MAWPSLSAETDEHLSAPEKVPEDALPALRDAFNATQAIIAARGAVDGIPSLDGTGVIPEAQRGGAHQPYSVVLAAIAALTLAANKIVYYTATDTAATADLSAFARGLLALTTDGDFRQAIGAEIGVDVQIWAQILDLLIAAKAAADVAGPPDEESNPTRIGGFFELKDDGTVIFTRDFLNNLATQAYVQTEIDAAIAEIPPSEGALTEEEADDIYVRLDSGGATGVAVYATATAAAARTAIGLTSVGSAVGTAATEAAGRAALSVPDFGTAGAAIAEMATAGDVNDYLGVGAVAFDFFTDYIGSNMSSVTHAPFGASSVGTGGTLGNLSGSAGHIGVVGLRSGTVSGAGYVSGESHMGRVLEGGEVHEVWFRVDAISSDSIFLGANDVSTGATPINPANCVGLIVDNNGGNPRFTALVTVASSDTTHGTVYTGALATWYRAVISIAANLASARFILLPESGTTPLLDVTLTTSLPTATLGFRCLCTSTDTSGTRFILALDRQGVRNGSSYNRSSYL